MTMRAAALGAALMTFPAAAETDLDLPPDFWRERTMELSRTTTTHEWPFTVDSGELACIIFAGNRAVFFSEPDPNPDWFEKGEPYQSPRMVAVSVNPLEIFATFEDASLYAPWDSDFAVLIGRLAPFAAMGQEMCNQMLAEERDAGEDGAEGGQGK